MLQFCSIKFVQGYRAAISDTLSHLGRDIGHDKYISSLIQSFDRDRPGTRSLAPRWNLAWVLNVLSKEPFEPLSSISMELLSYKTAFLLAFASARRVSELHVYLSILCAVEWSPIRLPCSQNQAL